MEIQENIQNCSETYHYIGNGNYVVVEVPYYVYNNEISKRLYEYSKQVFLEKNALPKEVCFIDKNGYERIIQLSASNPKINFLEANKEDCTAEFVSYEYILPKTVFDKVVGVTTGFFSSWAMSYRDMKALSIVCSSRYTIKYSLKGDKSSAFIQGKNLWANVMEAGSFHFGARTWAFVVIPFAMTGFMTYLHIQGVCALLGKIFSSLEKSSSYYEYYTNFYSQDVIWLISAWIAPETTLGKIREMLTKNEKNPFFKPKEDFVHGEKGFLELSTEIRSF